MGIRTAITRFIEPAPRCERLPRRRWQRAGVAPSSLRLLSSAIALVDAEPELAELGPDGLAVAWRIFRPGWNTSRNGPVLFDDLAAELVMADYREHSARIQVDMDHVSLNKESAAYDPRGLGYHDLELRDDGSLWACNAVWTKRGAACLESDPDAGRAAELPYYSPAFDTDTDLQFGDEPDRVTYIFNGGLVGTPATDRPMALAKAASRHKGQLSMDPKQALKAFRAMSEADRGRLTQIWRLTDSQIALPSAKLAELLKWQDSPDDVDPKVLAGMVKAMGGDPTQGIGGLMRQLRTYIEMAMRALAGEEPAPEAVPTTAEPETMADNPEDKREPELMAAQRKQADELRQLRQAREADRKLVDELRQERQAERHRRRMDLLALAVSTGRLDRARAYEDPTVKTADELKPKGSFATMSLEELKTEWTEGPVLTNVFGAAPQPASGYTGSVTQPGLFEVSQHEMDCLKERAKKMGRDFDWAKRRYFERRKMQVKGAQAAGDTELLRVLSRRYVLDRTHPDAGRNNVVLRDPGRHWTPDDLKSYRTWASQAPIDQYAAVSIAAMREFDLTYNLASATPGPNWAEMIGDIRPAGSIADTTFPLTFQEFFYTKETAQAPKGETPNLWSVDVRKEPYDVGASASLRLLNTPEAFDHINEDWLRAAEGMATGLWDLQQELAAEIFTGNAPIYKRFLDGKVEQLTDKNIFAIDHPIHPFDDTVVDVNGDDTWGNYQTSATPFNPTNLTAEKQAFDMTPNGRGRFMRMPATHILHPTILGQTVHNAITVQDLILAGALTQDSGAGVGTMGTVRNQHTGSGLLQQEIEHLPGSDPATADWMLFSQQRKEAGMVPFVVCMSATEEVTIYDEGSDYAKRTKHIRQERVVFIKVIPLHPQAVRWIKGS
jgi:hypothetical protein